MPRAKQQTAFLGDLTVKILHGVPVEQAGWLIKALVVWIEDKREPTCDEIPPECLGAWIAIRDESVRIHESMHESEGKRSEAGRVAAAARWGMRNDAKECERMESHDDRIEKRCDPMPDSDSDNKKDRTHPSGSCDQRPPAREEPASHIDPGADFTPSYIVEDWEAICMQAHVAGLTQDQLAAWRDYYAAQGWKFKPTATAPMNRTEALASVRNWARAQKRIDIRDLRRGDPSKFAPSPDKGGIDPAKLGI